MSLEERADLILAFAKVLYVNGPSTDQICGTLYRCCFCSPSFGTSQMSAEARSALSFSDSERRWSSRLRANAESRPSMNMGVAGVLQLSPGNRGREAAAE
jgi:hypothetical protein